jgi:predicted TIM-barrel fold metal-dependent hydrolase
MMNLPDLIIFAPDMITQKGPTTLIATATSLLWFMVIDAHVHIPLDRDEWAAFRRMLAAHGVTHSVVLPLGRWEHYPDAASVSWSNDEVCAYVADSDGRASWLAYLNPQNDDWRRELDRCVGRGAIGIKLWISLKDAAGSLDNCRAVLARAGDLGIPALIHTYDRSGEPNHAGEITLAEFAGLADAYPDVKMIAAHAGADWRSAIGILRRRAPNAVVDVSGSFPEAGMVEALIGDLGQHRVLFGSDAFGRSVPSQLAKVTLAEIDADAREAVLWRNAARVFDITPAPAAVTPPAAAAADRLPLDTDTDHTCFCGAWPFFPTPCAAPADLERALVASGVSCAYVADLGSIYRRDLEPANAAFAAAAHGCDRIATLAAINPMQQNWHRVVDIARAAHHGALLYPTLHAWSLTEPAARACADRCAASAWPVWLNCALGDARFRHCGTVWRDVAPEEITAFLATAPANTYIFQGLARAQVEAALAAGAARPDVEVRCDISRLTDIGKQWLELQRAYGADAFVHGSEFPLRHLLQVRDALAQLAAAQQENVLAV